MEAVTQTSPAGLYSLAWHMFLTLPEWARIVLAFVLVILLVIGFYLLPTIARYFLDPEVRRLRAELERVEDLTVQIEGVLWVVAGGIYSSRLAKSREEYYRRLLSHSLNALLRSLGTQRNEQHRVSVLVPDEAEQNMVWYDGTGFAPDDHEKVRHAIGTVERYGSAAGEAYLTRRPVYVPDVRKYEYWEPSTTGHEYRTLYVVPLMAERKCRGVLCVDGKKPEMFSEKDRTFIRLFAAIVLGIMGAEERSRGERGGEFGGLQDGGAQRHGLVGGEASA